MDSRGVTECLRTRSGFSSTDIILYGGLGERKRDSERVFFFKEQRIIKKEKKKKIMVKNPGKGINH